MSIQIQSQILTNIKVQSSSSSKSWEHRRLSNRITRPSIRTFFTATGTFSNIAFISSNSHREYFIFVDLLVANEIPAILFLFSIFCLPWAFAWIRSIVHVNNLVHGIFLISIGFKEKNSFLGENAIRFQFYRFSLEVKLVDSFLFAIQSINCSIIG